MGRGEYLGEFEQIVLLAVLALGQEAYGMRVREEIRHRGGRDVSVPTVYAALERLEQKGWASSHVGESTPERGGRAKKMFAVTASGLNALHESRARLDRMWDAVPDHLEPKRS